MTLTPTIMFKERESERSRDRERSLWGEGQGRRGGAEGEKMGEGRKGAEDSPLAYRPRAPIL